MPNPTANRLYYGDNLPILRQYVADESIDLVYLDPPFKSDQDYNVLFAEHGVRAAAQIKAFEDTWQWDEVAARAYQETVEAGGRVSQALQAFRTFLGESDMLAYLAMMAPRLVELRRVLKTTGNIYLHCDPTASHYLKMLLDGVFGPQNFRNEIIWQRTSSHNDSNKWASIHDTILFYSKGKRFTWNNVYTAYDPKYIASFFRYEDEHGRYRLHEIIRTASMGPRPNLSYSYGGYKPEWGWRVIKEKLEAIDKAGRLTWSKSGRPYLKRYLAEQSGTPISSMVTDIPPIGAKAAERLGYPTQKPEAFLERIIKASSNEGDVVLDPFCGCGTAVAVAQRLDRRWIGIDITHLAIGLIKHRLVSAHGESVLKTIEVIGEPVNADEARQLAADDKYQFQWWALGLVGAKPTDQKKGSDKGIDGRIYFHDEASGDTKQIILSVKGGHLKATDVRDLVGVVEREKAAIGVLISLEAPTKPMRTEAASGGFYTSQWGQHSKIQLRTVAELLDGKGIDKPPSNVTLKAAPKAKPKAENIPLFAAAVPPMADDDE